jgi:hypothetical protein
LEFTILALTRSQLIAGNSSLGVTLPGQPQGVTAGVGVTISPTGVLSIDLGPGFNSFIKTNSAAAFNNYIWPNTAGSAGAQLTTDGSGNLTWSDSDGIPWTAKGQLIVGTGVGTDVLLNVGTDTSVLVANSASASGLAYSNTITSAISLPAGTTANQPGTPSVGMVRYNTTNNEFEGYSGSPASWQALGGQPTGGANDKIFYLNSQNVTTNYTLPSVPLAKNAMSAGPITINAGITVTVPAGQSWSIV